MVLKSLAESCLRWSPCWMVLAGLGFLQPSLIADIVITEIHYDPVDSTRTPRPDLEFVELYNDSPDPYDLYLCRFTRGFAYEFTERIILEGRSYVVVCRNVNALKTEYGISNAVGNFDGALNNSGETVEFSNPQGIPMSSVSYNDRNRWPAGAKGTGHSLSIEDPYSDPSDPDSWDLSVQLGGTPGMANFGGDASYRDTVLIDSDEVWRYFKGTREPSSPTSAWRQIGFNDSTWLTGATGIGYGDGDDATVLSDMEDNYLTVFCRKTFTVSDPDEVDNLILSVVYDDGFYAYLNGGEVASRNVSGRDFNDGADSAGDPELADIDISSYKNLLTAGTNVLAVQVHNANLGSSDLSFIPRLISRELVLPEQSQTVPVEINEAYLLNGDGAERFVELYNKSDTTIDLEGYYLTDDFLNLTNFEIPAPTTMPPRGFLSFTESELGFDLAIDAATRDRIGIALTNPAGTRVVDAVIFRPLVDSRSEARVPDGYRNFAPAADPTPGAANQVTVNEDVILNEIMYHPITEQSLDEFLELYNRGATSADLGNWRIEGVGLVFPEGTTLGPGEYLVVSEDPERLGRVYGLDPQVLSEVGWNGALRDSGERLNLRDANDNVVDTVRFHDGGEWSLWADGGGSSLERIDPNGFTDSAETWDASDDSDKAVAQTIGYGNVPYGGGESDLGMMLAEEGIVIIDDISLTRTGTATNLVSNGTFDSSTSPWRIEGTHIRSGRTTDPLERINGSGSLKLICWGGGGDYKVNRVETDTGQQSSGTYSVSYKARWVVGSPRVITVGDYNVGQPHNAGIAGSLLVNPPRRLGTPGAINSVTLRQLDRTGSTNVGPAFSRVRHSPGVPEGNETVTVSARVRDPDGVNEVTLYYALESPGSFTSRTMSGPDAEGVFTATIPGQSLGVKVLFYVVATDDLGAASRFPKDILLTTHPPVLDPETASENVERYCLYRHDTRVVSTRHHSYRFVLDEQDENYLRTRKVLSNEMVEGTFVFGSDKVYYNAGIRFAGSPWLRPGGGSWGKSYTLRMPKDDWLHDRKRNFNLDQHGTDGRERISHYLLRWSAGYSVLPYYDFQSLVRFQLNDVRDSVYDALDKPNSQYIDYWFPDEDGGQNFEMDDRFSFNDSGSKTGNAEGKVLYPPYGSTSGGANKENYRWYFNPRSNENVDDFSGVMNLCMVLDPRMTSNSNFDRLVWQFMDVEEVLRVWAVRLHTDDWDTWGARRGKNCYFYRSTTTGLWCLVPWDLELTYGDVNAFALPSSPTSTISNHYTEVQRMLNRPQIKRLYYGILAEQVDPTYGFFHSGFLTPFMDRLSAAGVGNTGIGRPGGFVDQRASRIRSWVRNAVYPQKRLQITTNGGTSFEALEPFVDLAGSAPADAFFFLAIRNGEPIEPQPAFELSDTDMFGWSVSDIPLAGGDNTLTILGLGSRGNIVDQDSIVVSSPEEWEPPAIEALQPSSGATLDGVTIEGTDFHRGLQVIFGGSVNATEIIYDEDLDPTRILAVVPDGLGLGASSVQVRNLDGQTSGAVPFTVLPPLERFIRGDADLSGLLELSDALKILFHLFHGVDVSCVDALDVNDTGTVEVTDALRVLNYLFQAGPPPAAPYPLPGSDPTRGDALDCEDGG